MLTPHTWELKALARAAWQQAVTRGASGMPPDEEEMFEAWWAATAPLNGWA